MTILRTTNLNYTITVSLDEDMVRERLIFGFLFDKKLYFCVEKGYISELELELTSKHPSIPIDVNNLSKVKNLVVFIHDMNSLEPEINLKLDSLQRLLIFVEPSVRTPEISLKNFPNLKKFRIIERRIHIPP